MKKVILIFLLLAASVVGVMAKDPIWMRTNGIKITTTQEWPDSWMPCVLDIKFDFSLDQIVIYSKELQVLKIDYNAGTEVQNYYQIFKYKCTDTFYRSCYVYLYYDYEDEIFRSLIIKYADGMYAYKLY